MRRHRLPFAARLRLFAVLFVSFVFIPLNSSTGHTAILTVTDSTTFIEEETSFLFNRSLLSVAAGGGCEALLYWDESFDFDDETMGLFMLLIGPDGQKVTDTIQIVHDLNSKTNGDLLWDGEAFLVLYTLNQQLRIKRISTDGAVLSDIPTELFVSTDQLAAMLEGNTIRLVISDSGEAWVSYAELSTSGKRILGPFYNSVSGTSLWIPESKRVEFLPEGFAVLSCRSWLNSKSAVLEILDKRGYLLREPIPLVEDFRDFSADMHWNGQSLVIASSFALLKDSIKKSHNQLYFHDHAGNQMAEPKPFGEDPFGNPRLVWANGCYLLLFVEADREHAQLIDPNGSPLSEPVLLTEEPSGYTGKMGVLAGNAFSVYGTKPVSNTVINRHGITWDTLAPTVTPTPTPPADAPTPTPILPADVQELRLKVNPDLKNLYVHIQGDRLWLDSGTALPSTLIRDSTVEVNGQEWKPVWNGTLSDSYQFAPPLPQSEGYEYRTIDNKFGFLVPLIQEPKASNQYEAVLLAQTWITYQYGSHHEIKLIWSKTPLRPAVSLPEKNYLLWRGVIINPASTIKLKIRDRQVNLYVSSRGQKAYTLDTVFSEPLPSQPVTVQASVLQGGLVCNTVQQPLEDNQYTAEIDLKEWDNSRLLKTEAIVLITWTGGSTAEMTPTPTPTWNPTVPTPTPTPTSSLSGQDTEARTLLDQTLQANRSWLDPRPIKASYTRLDENGQTSFVEVDGGGPTRERIGTWFYTPLHVLYHSGMPYQVKMIGATTVESKTVIAMDVTLSEEAQQLLFSHDSPFNERYYRIGIDPEKKLPLFIGGSQNSIRSDQTDYSHACYFDPQFFEVDGGYAPSFVRLEESAFYRYNLHNFQIYEGVWILNTSESWIMAEYPWNTTSLTEDSLMSTVEIQDLQIKEIYTPVGNWMTY